ncbi:NAD-dependent epimerase/dehydratase family protein [Emticicia sp. CRIBPO]|uniref:NAD-dependent epimerase/dehydratase family protein n=1 Tax=Emticicia sp. CRIBPO TaxID=2683258 RepID=UPI001411F97E|nr:NAD(P)-dependent oxidoreductase [Emticicia sp. CRIBPO]NBA85275.1 NAD-dependent epimerase/dehydratase family protein [Emticicia sp. CRIBPO]
MKSFLITGGSGFIGTNLIDLLITSGYKEIINFDKASPVKPDHAKFWYEGNIMEISGLKSAFREYNPDVVIHLAARTDTLSDKLEDYVENHIGTKNLLEVIKETKSVKQAIITSTQYVYKSDENVFPSNEVDFSPHTIYGQSKVLTETYTREANLECDFTIVRPTNIWGPWHMRYPIELWKVIDKGIYFHPVKHEVIRTYGYVGNTVYQILKILESPSELTNKKVFYLGDAPIDSYLWLNELSLGLTDKKIKRLPKFIFKTAALCGDFLRLLKIPFPLYSKRFNNMIEDYPAPTDVTIGLFGQADSNLRNNVKETILWLKGEGKGYFEYWKNK